MLQSRQSLSKKQLNLLSADNFPFGSASFLQNVKELGQMVDLLGYRRTSLEWSCWMCNPNGNEVGMHNTPWCEVGMHNTRSCSYYVTGSGIFILQPCAMEHAVHTWSNPPKQDHQMAPLELFSRIYVIAHFFRSQSIYFYIILQPLFCNSCFSEQDRVVSQFNWLKNVIYLERQRPM